MLAVSTGHAGLSGALRTVEPLPRWEVTAALPVIRSMTRVPARAMGQVSIELEGCECSCEKIFTRKTVHMTPPRAKGKALPIACTMLCRTKKIFSCERPCGNYPRRCPRGYAGKRLR